MEQFHANGMVDKLTKKYLSIVQEDCTSPTVYNNENYEHNWLCTDFPTIFVFCDWSKYEYIIFAYGTALE
jgi:hypothetical protein